MGIWNSCEASSLFLIFKKSLFVYFERARAQVGEGQREGERNLSRLHAVSAEPNVRLRLTSHETVT